MKPTSCKELKQYKAFSVPFSIIIVEMKPTSCKELKRQAEPHIQGTCPSQVEMKPTSCKELKRTRAAGHAGHASGVEMKPTSCKELKHFDRAHWA